MCTVDCRRLQRPWKPGTGGWGARQRRSSVVGAGQLPTSHTPDHCLLLSLRSGIRQLRHVAPCAPRWRKLSCCKLPGYNHQSCWSTRWGWERAHAVPHRLCRQQSHSNIFTTTGPTCTANQELRIGIHCGRIATSSDTSGAAARRATLAATAGLCAHRMLVPLYPGSLPCPLMACLLSSQP